MKFYLKKKRKQYKTPTKSQIYAHFQLPSSPFQLKKRASSCHCNARIILKMVAFTLSQNSSVQLRSSLVPQKTQYLNLAPQFRPVNDVNLRGMQSKEIKVFPRTRQAISENKSSNSRGLSAKNFNPVIVIDNYDSFTYNLCQYMGELGCNFEVYRNDELTVDELKKKNPRGILISPGPGAPQDSGISLQTVLELGPVVPLFGVCMGLQCIGEAFGVLVFRAFRANFSSITDHIHVN
ncbi:putative anthranilate synthase [Helianthus anomalus]